MKFGLIPPYAMGPVEEPEYAAEFAQLAEGLGFESLWTVEHHVMPVDYDSPYPYDPSGRTPFGAHVPVERAKRSSPSTSPEPFEDVTVVDGQQSSTLQFRCATILARSITAGTEAGRFREGPRARNRLSLQ